MGQDVSNDLRFCQIPPGPKKGLNWLLKLRTMNWHLKPRIIFVAMSLIIILMAGLAYYYLPLRYWPIEFEGPEGLWHPDVLTDPVGFLFISFAQIIMLGAGWKTLSGIIEFNNLKPRTIYVAMILLFILLSGRAYLYMPMIFHPGAFLFISFAEIIMLWAVWKVEKNVAGIRESNKTKTSIFKTGIARGVDWQWVLIGFSFLLLLLWVGWALFYGELWWLDPASLLFTIFVEIIMLGAVWKMLSGIREFNKIKTSSTN